ncbi:hypothetical protein FBU30_002620, partial [Linnemannia zychae]
MSREQYQVLGIVSKNDYTFNLPGLGIARNTAIIKECTADNDTVQNILEKYEFHPEVLEAFKRLAEQDQSTQSAKPVSLSVSMNVYVNGQETLLTSDQKTLKRMTETLLQMRVNSLKERMTNASRTRREAIKTKRAQGEQMQRTGPRNRHHQKYINRFTTVNGPSAPKALKPTESVAPVNQALPSTGDAMQRQNRHWLSVESRREERPLAVARRARNCKTEHHSQGFDNLPSKQYAIKVHVVQDRPNLHAGSDLADPDLEFKPFKPYTSLDSVKQQTKKQSMPHTPRAGPLSKSDVVMSITGSHQMIMLNVGQLGRNVGQAVIATRTLPSANMPHEEARVLTEKARTATIETIRRIVRVSNNLLRHGQK